MMRIQPISTSVTLAMMAIVLAAPLAVNFILSATAHKAPATLATPGTTQAQHAEHAPTATDYFR